MSTAASRASTRPGLHYQVRAHSLHAHLYAVTLTIHRPAAQQRVSLPVWIAGSYLVREFAKHLQGLTAQQGQTAVAVTQLDKASWQLACQPDQPLVRPFADGGGTPADFS